MNPAKRSAGRAEVSARPLVTSSDLEAFHKELFLPLVWRATWRHGLSKEDAKDVVQEAFMLAVVRLHDAGNPRAWLAQVVDHLSANHRRKTFRRARLTAKWGESGSVEGDPLDASEDIEMEVDH